MNAFQEAIKALLIKARDEGLTRNQAAEAFGLTYETVCNRIRHFGIAWPHGLSETREPNERARAMVARSEAGESLQEIATDYGITRERVRQIVKKSGAQSKRQMTAVALVKLAEFLKDNPMTLTEAARTTGAPYSALDRARGIGVEFLKMPAEREAELSSLAEKVKAGASINEACGGDRSLAARLYHYCHTKGIKSTAPTRWTVSPQRAETIARLFAEGKSWPEISDAVTELEGTRPYKSTAIYNWALANMDLPKRAGEPKPRKPRKLREARTPSQPKVKLVRPPNQPAEVEIRETIRETAIVNRGKATASEIAAACGTTRNAVIGHWFRARQNGAAA